MISKIYSQVTMDRLGWILTLDTELLKVLNAGIGSKNYAQNLRSIRRAARGELTRRGINPADVDACKPQVKIETVYTQADVDRLRASLTAPKETAKPGLKVAEKVKVSA
jgi:hypothetical protein